MNKSFTSCLALFCLTAAFLSCGGGRKGDNQAVAGKADTAKVVKEVQPLPDTMYAFCSTLTAYRSSSPCPR